jgi:hypothetical protein
MGYTVRQAKWVSRIPARIGHPLTFYFDPRQKVGYWYHAERFYPVKSYPARDWKRWGAVIRRAPFKAARRMVSPNPGSKGRESILARLRWR